jgi:pimeloyl-ACP methyl ester carboxylesterase
VSKDIYVIVPGILGSILERNGRDVFGFSLAAGLKALFSGGRVFDELQLSPTSAEAPDDGVVAGRLAEVSLIPGFWKIDIYTDLAKYIEKELDAIPGESLFEFPYDWRLDNRIAAHRLQTLSRTWLQAKRQQYPDAKLVLVAHSMGGLVSRYFLEVLDGWRDTKALITFGTPFRGSLKALNVLVDGLRPVGGLVDLTPFVRSLPSVYQLLPIYPCVIDGSGPPRYISAVCSSLKPLDCEAVDAARAFHQEIEDAFAAHTHNEEYQRSRYRLHQVVGIHQPTAQSAVLSGGRLEILDYYRRNDLSEVDERGDGTVPRPSASPLEYDDDSNAMFSGTAHASLQRSTPVLIQLQGWMTSPQLGVYRAEAPISLQVTLDDLHPPERGIRFTVEPTEATLDLRYGVEWVGGPNGTVPEPVTGTLPAVDGPRTGATPPLPPGVYRLTVTGAEDVAPFSDLVVVAPTERVPLSDA